MVPDIIQGSGNYCIQHSHNICCMFVGEMCGQTSLQCLQVMFLFTDAHVANESFLELINNMLTSGMIPALYDDGEKESLISGIREEVIRCHAGAVQSKYDLRSRCCI
jgi:hypothetical protein